MSVGKVTNNDSALNLTRQEKLKTTLDLNSVKPPKRREMATEKNVLGTGKVGVI